MTNTTLIPSIFSFHSKDVRVIDVNGLAWFIAADVCAALEIKNTTQAVARLDDDERSMLNIGLKGDVVIINLYGLFSLILGSRKKEAKEFKRWVTHNVLPSIYKTGKYEAPNLKTKKALPNGLTLDQCDSVKALVKARVEPLPKEKQGKAAIRCWSAIKSKFGCGYKEVPPEHFTEVLSLIARLPLEGEFIAKDDSGPKGLHNVDTLNQSIDAQGLLFGNLPKSDVPLPDELKLEVEKKAFEMGHHAYELSKEHLARVIRYRNYTKAHGYLKESALRTIQETTLDNALVHPHLFKLDMIRTCSMHLTAICSELNQDIERALMNEKKVLTAH